MSKYFNTNIITIIISITIIKSNKENKLLFNLILNKLELLLLG